MPRAALRRMNTVARVIAIVVIVMVLYACTWS
jgi:hypothetical protein